MTSVAPYTKKKGKVIYIVLPFYGGFDTAAFSKAISTCGYKFRALERLQCETACLSWTLAQPRALDVFQARGG